jgi:threonine/homoserine/homoserine lactone efflux protein
VTEGEALAVFAGVIAVGQFSPGPDMVLLTRTSLAHGGRAGTWTAIGIACGLTLHAAVAMGGVSVFLTGESPLARGLRLAAALYLAWLAWQLLRAAWRGGGADAANASTPGGGGAACWRRGWWCNLLNPKVALFFAAITAPFLTAERPHWWPWVLGAMIVVQGFVLWTAWAWALQWAPLRLIYQKSARWLDALFGCALLALAVRVFVQP